MRLIGTLGALVAAAVLVAGCATITILPNGQVMLVSGVAKLYDPATGTSTLPAQPSEPRIFHTATLLNDGRTLVVGGAKDQGSLDTAELYDPTTGTWSPTGSMAEARAMHTATLLKDGRVLVTGGGTVSTGTSESAPPLDSAEVYDPATGTFSPVGALADGRVAHLAALLPDGRVLVVGGSGGDLPVVTGEIFDPATGQFTPTGSLSTPRGFATATTLQDGRVMVIGGAAGSISAGDTEANKDVLLATTEVYDPATGVFTPAAEMSVPRMAHSATRLLDGRILVAGGIDAAMNGYATAEVYDPATDTFSPTGSMAAARFGHAADLLPDGRVIVAGAIDTANMANTSDLLMNVEVWDPATGVFTLTELVPAPSPAPS